MPGTVHCKCGKTLMVKRPALFVVCDPCDDRNRAMCLTLAEIFGETRLGLLLLRIATDGRASAHL